MEEKGYKFIDRSIVDEVPTKKELKEWIKLSNKDIKKWFNTSGLIYKELKLKDKLDKMTEEEKLKLLSENGKLIKRPILVNENMVLIGFNKEEWESI